MAHHPDNEAAVEILCETKIQFRKLIMHLN